MNRDPDAARVAQVLSDALFEDDARDHADYPDLVVVLDGRRTAELTGIWYDARRNVIVLDAVEDVP